MTDVIDNLVDRAPDGEVEIAESSFSLEYSGNWKLHRRMPPIFFHPTIRAFVRSVLPARKAPENASILDQDQTRAMLLANGFGFKEWEGIQLSGLDSGHTYMTSFYDEGVLANQKQNQDPVSVQYRAMLTEKLGKERADRRSPA